MGSSIHQVSPKESAHLSTHRPLRVEAYSDVEY